MSKTIKPSYEKIRKKFENKNLILLSKSFKNEKDKLKCMDYDGYLYSISYNNNTLINNSIPEKFNVFNNYTVENIQHYLDSVSSGVKLLSNEFKGSHEKLVFLCPNCQKEYKRSWDMLYSKHKFLCNDCANKNRKSNKYSFDFVKNKLSEKGYLLLDNEYFGNNDNLNCVDKNGYRVHIKFTNIINGSKKNPYIFSPVFNSENFIYNINNYFKLNNINCIALYYLKEDNRYSEGIYTLYCKCECGEIFNTTFDSIKIGQYRCKKCSNYCSNIEKKVKIWLENKHIKYVSQKTFNDCINDKTNRKLFFDFYLPKYRICIEVDGEQHEKIIKFHNQSDEDALDDLKNRQYKDTIKNNYCKDNNIKLIRIPENKIERRHEEYKKILYENLIKN